MDYEKEVEKLNTSDTWKPKVGVHEFVILSEPEKTEFIEENKPPTPQIKVDIEINKEMKTWYIGVGKTMKSAYGQLMVIGKYYKTLVGQKIELIVQESKDKNGETKNSYMFPLAAKIIQAEKDANRQETKRDVHSDQQKGSI